MWWLHRTDQVLYRSCDYAQRVPSLQILTSMSPGLTATILIATVLLLATQGAGFPKISLRLIISLSVLEDCTRSGSFSKECELKHTVFSDSGLDS